MTDVNGNTVTSDVSYLIVVDSDDGSYVDINNEVIEVLMYQNELIAKIYQLLVFFFICAILWLIFRSFIYF